MLKSYREADHTGGDAGSDQLLVGQLTVGLAGGMQHAGADVRHVDHVGSQLQAVHKLDRIVSSAFEGEGQNAAGAEGQVFFRQFMIGVGGKSGVVDELDLIVGSQKFRNDLGVFAVALHAHSQSLQTQIQQEGVDGGGIGAKVTHQLGAGLGDESGFAKAFHIAHAVIALVRLDQLGISAVVPVKVTAVHDHAAYLDGMTVHVFGGGVDHDIGAELDGTAQNGGGKGIVHDQRHIVFVGDLGKALDVKYGKGRVGDGLAENEAGVGADQRRNFLRRSIGIDEGI